MWTAGGPVHLSHQDPDGQLLRYTQQTGLYLVCGPLDVHRHDEVCVVDGLQGEHTGIHTVLRNTAINHTTHSMFLEHTWCD